MNIQNKKILILGVSSWLGYLLANKLLDKKVKVAGTVYKSSFLFDENIEIYRPRWNDEDYIKVLDSFKPSVIVNFLRGEDVVGLKIHSKIIEWCKANGSLYIYASSVLALDAHKDVSITELLEAKSVSPYGIFKAQCERVLYDSNISWTVLRFASVQGWVPHKPTRNEGFLRKLANQQEVFVERGIIQNRILASLLIDGIFDLIKDRIIGIIHFGAEDSSEEYSFLKKEAQLFGFQPDLVKSGNMRQINLVAVPGKIYSLYGDRYRVTEDQMLEGLTKIKELNQIK